MTVVLDTNVVFAALVSQGLCQELFERTIRIRALATSIPLLDELEEIIVRKLKPAPAAAAFLREFRRHARLVVPARLPGPVCRDPDDDIVLATAVAADADAIVTGDNDLLVLKKYQRMPILTPRQYVELLTA